jgi:hypothetical protein
MGLFEFEGREAAALLLARLRASLTVRPRDTEKSETGSMDGKRALRRAHARRMKDRARRVMKRWFGRFGWPLDPRKVGVNASTHCRPCACSMCQEDSRFPPMRERAFHDPDWP